MAKVAKVALPLHIQAAAQRSFILTSSHSEKSTSPKTGAKRAGTAKRAQGSISGAFGPKKSAAHASTVSAQNGSITVYGYSGKVRDLQKDLEDANANGKIRTFLVPETPEAGAALRRAPRFRVFRGSKSKGDPKRVQEMVALIKAHASETSAESADSPVEIASAAYHPDARARAILRGKAYAEADLRAAGGAFDIDEVRTLLNGVTRQAVDKRVNDGALLAVPGPSARRRFPTVQFNTDGSVVAGLKEVQAALDFSSPFAVLNFLVNENDQLGGKKPIDELRRGAVDRVVQAANSVGVQGA